MNFKILIPALIIAVGIVIFGGFALPTFLDSGQLRAARSARVELLAKKTALVEKEFQLKADLKKNQTKLSRLDLLIPATPHEDELITNLDQIAKTSGIPVKTMAIAFVNDNSGARNFKELLTEVTSSGNYINFRDWLGRWEKNIRLLDVQEFSISPDLAGGNLLFSIKAKSYYAK